MMENPFFSNYWSSPRFRTRSTEEIPVNRQQQQRTPLVPKSSPKVVSIPVHFVGSEERRSAAALRIQKVFRGFLVRKSVKKIVGIKREVDEIERRISQRDMIDAIRRDSKERLKVNEMLMALLLRLDSVRGVDSGVRECRKSVIKKAIMLQERVDAIATEQQTRETSKTEDEGSEMEEEEVLEAEGSQGNNQEPLAEAVDQPEDVKIVVENHEAIIEDGNPGAKEDDAVVVDQPEEMKVAVENHEAMEDVNPGAKENDTDAVDAATAEGDHEPVVEVAGDQISELQVSVESPQVEPLENSHLVPEFEGNLEANADKGDATLEEVSVEPEDLMETVEEDEKKPSTDDEEEQGGIMDDVQQVNGEQKLEEDSRTLMQRMIVGNERLTTLVTELCERNTLQTQLINSLSQRVENLEKAFKSERSKRRKKKHA